jgi:hypothetical protein
MPPHYRCLDADGVFGHRVNSVAVHYFSMAALITGRRQKLIVYQWGCSSILEGHIVVLSDAAPA